MECPYASHRDRTGSLNTGDHVNAARHTVTVTSEMTLENRMVLDVTAASR